MGLLRNIPFSPPDITNEEIMEVVDTLKSGWITTGPKTKEFERKIAKYIGTTKAVCLNSATASMELTLRLLGIGPGDEVITSAYTYTATASVINHVGAKIVLVDTAKGSFEMDYEQLEEVITDNTKAIIPVDIAGKMCDYDEIFRIVNNKKSLFKAENKLQEKINRIVVLADAAHSFGATYNNNKSGQVADFTCFSFHAVKNLTTAEGGAVVWNTKLQLDDDFIYNEYMLLSLHGQSKDALSKMNAGSWEYDIVYPGYKCNMTDLMAGIGLKQLERYDEMLVQRRLLIKRYDKLLENTNINSLKHLNKDAISSGHLYLTNVSSISELQRNEIINSMAENGVAVNVHYKPLPMLTAYKNMGFNIKDYPNSYNQYKNQISLPLHTKLSISDIDYIVAKYNEAVLKV